MRLRPVKRAVAQPTPEPPKERPRRKKSDNTLPSDKYTPIFPPVRFKVSDKPSYKDPTKSVKHYLEVSVKRADDEEALPMCYIGTYQESDFYTGYLKGKTVCLPINELSSLIEVLSDLEEQCNRENLMDEYE